MKANGRTSHRALYLMAVVTLIVSVLTGCSFMKKFHASDDLVGKIELFKTVDGFEKIDDKYIPEFVETVNKKYSIKADDMRQTGDMTAEATLDYSDETIGDMELEFNMEGDRLFLEYSKADQLMHMNMDLKIESLGLSDTYAQEVYMDFAEMEQYTRVSVSGAAGEWTKEKITDEQDPESLGIIVQLSEGEIKAIYQDPESKGYAVVLKGDQESSSNSIVSQFSEAFVNSDMELNEEKAQIIMTFDEGLSYAGINSTFSDITAENSTYEKIEISVKMESVNEGISVTLPDEAISAGEQTGGSGILDEIGDAAEEEKAEEAASDSKQEETKNTETEDTNTQSQSGEDIPVIVNGVEIQMGRMTVQEIADATGLPIAEEDEGKVVSVNGSEMVKLDTGEAFRYISLSADNIGGDSTKDAKDCIAHQVTYMILGSTEKDELLSVAGITIGDSEEDIIEALGEPSDVFESGETEIKSLTYNINKYHLMFMLSGSEGVNVISVGYYDF